MRTGCYIAILGYLKKVKLLNIKEYYNLYIRKTILSKKVLWWGVLGV